MQQHGEPDKGGASIGDGLGHEHPLQFKEAGEYKGISKIT